MNKKMMLVPLLLLFCGYSNAQKNNIEPNVQDLVNRVNYDEEKVPFYTLPDPLLCEDGTMVHSAVEWKEKRRPEVLHLFEENIYGKQPRTILPEIRYELLTENRNALNGLAIRKEIRIYLTPKDPGFYIDLLLYLPRKEKKPVPIFLGINGNGNQTIHPDPEIKITEKLITGAHRAGIVSNRATDASRGSFASRYQVEKVLKRGYGVATFYCGDVMLDLGCDERFGIHQLFYEKDQRFPKPDDWGTISKWAWGISRCIDYLERDKEVDSKHIIVWGHSRRGKTALWASALDERIAMCISNESGSGGAALARRRFGEYLQLSSHPLWCGQWYCANYRKYSEREDMLPVDQHMLIALIAPRPVYVGTASEDLWADPKGSFLALKNAESVYRLFGIEGMPTDTMPKVNTPITGFLGFHNRTGVHDVTEYDFDRYLDFADYHFNKKKE